jgi:hypothetical protein
MNTLVATFYRDVSCGAAAILIAVIATLSFVQATSVPPGMHAARTSFVARQPAHAWFGQPEPAVLVD